MGLEHFDGVNLKELKGTVGDSSSGLVKQVSKNQTDISSNSSLIQSLSTWGQTINCIRGSVTTDKYTTYVATTIPTVGFNGGQITISNSNISKDDHCIVTLEGIYVEGQEDAFKTDVVLGQPTFTVADSKITVNYNFVYRERNGGNQSTFKILVRYIVLKMVPFSASITTQSTPDQSATFDSTEEKEVLDDTETESPPADLENENPPVPENPETSPF